MGKVFKKGLSFALSILFFCAAMSADATDLSRKRIAPQTPLVQLALLLDTSGSMSGMIQQAKVQLWAIVNQFIKADQNGVRPQVEVALYRYGSPELGTHTGYVRLLVPLTGDLDRIAEELFKLSTNGGEEYCGWAIRTAVENLQWTRNNHDYKAIFIAGNEPFSQGPVDFRASCKNAISRGIVVNTIHCSGGDDSGWKDAALLADGSFMRIETNLAVVELDTPYDQDIMRLNSELNKTYIGYGAEGFRAMARQEAMDSASAKIGAANLAQRAVVKASRHYRTQSWDMVDAVEDKGIEAIAEGEMPANMQKMSSEERQAYVEKKKTEREDIQEQIQVLSDKRESYLRKRQKELAGNEKSLGSQIEQAVIQQAGKKGFSFE